MIDYLFSQFEQVSWCKFEVTIDFPKEIQVSTSSKNTSEIPPVVVTAINLKTIINEKQNVNEIVSASVICCHRAKVYISHEVIFDAANSIFFFYSSHSINSCCFLLYFQDKLFLRINELFHPLFLASPLIFHFFFSWKLSL